ncbi:unnamed protein product, partial [Meganyctiphanes norvegica]
LFPTQRDVPKVWLILVYALATVGVFHLAHRSIKSSSSSKSPTPYSKLLWTNKEFEKWYKQQTANIPIELLQSSTEFSDPKNCTKFPNLVDLNFNNIYWQSLKTKNNNCAYFLS